MTLFPEMRKGAYPYVYQMHICGVRVRACARACARTAVRINIANIYPSPREVQPRPPRWKSRERTGHAGPRAAMSPACHPAVS